MIRLWGCEAAGSPARLLALAHFALLCFAWQTLRSENCSSNTCSTVHTKSQSCSLSSLVQQPPDPLLHNCPTLTIPPATLGVLFPFAASQFSSYHLSNVFCSVWTQLCALGFDTAYTLCVTQVLAGLANFIPISLRFNPRQVLSNWVLKRRKLCVNVGANLDLSWLAYREILQVLHLILMFRVGATSCDANWRTCIQGGKYICIIIFLSTLITTNTNTNTDEHPKW